jgi:hypothetical protein
VGVGVGAAATFWSTARATGVSLDDLWTEGVFEIVDERRTVLINDLTFLTTDTATAVPQSISSPSFEDSSELRVPKAADPPAEALALGLRSVTLTGRPRLAIRSRGVRRTNSLDPMAQWAAVQTENANPAETLASAGP